MRVQRVVTPMSGAESWTVIEDDGTVVVPVERFLAHLAGIERSPNTVCAYAYGLRWWFEFLALRNVGWDHAGIEDVTRFVAWLRAPADNVIVLDGHTGTVRSAATVNRHLAALFGFYDFHARSGVELAASLVAWRRVARGSYKPFLHHVTKGRPVATRPVKLRVPRRLPTTLSAGDVSAVLAACEHLRDRFLIALLAETGMRIGQALGLRHADFVSRERRLSIVPRSNNANGARAKCVEPVSVPVSAPLVRLYSDYMHTEYGHLDSDYVFVNLWAEPIGRPLRYDAVAKLVGRLRARSGVEFTLHMLRHSRATELIRDGVPIEIVSKLLTHRSVTTTSSIYVHLDVNDLRAELVRAGAWETPPCQGDVRPLVLLKGPGGRTRLSVMTLPSDDSEQMVLRPGNRRHSKEFKERVVAEYDLLPMQTGERGSFLRAHRLGRHQISAWRAQQAGLNAGGTAGKTGRVPASRRPKRTPDQVENERLVKQNLRLQAELAATRLALEITGKAHAYAGDRRQEKVSVTRFGRRRVG